MNILTQQQSQKCLKPVGYLSSLLSVLLFSPKYSWQVLLLLVRTSDPEPDSGTWQGFWSFPKVQMGHIQLLKILSGLLWVCDAFPKDGCLSKLLFRYGIISTLCIKFFILSSLKVKMELREMKHKMEEEVSEQRKNQKPSNFIVTAVVSKWPYTSGSEGWGFRPCETWV